MKSPSSKELAGYIARASAAIDTSPAVAATACIQVYQARARGVPIAAPVAEADVAPDADVTPDVGAAPELIIVPGLIPAPDLISALDAIAAPDPIVAARDVTAGGGPWGGLHV